MPRTALTFPKRKTVENLLTNGDFEYAPSFTAATNTTSRWIDGTAGGSGASQSPYTWGIFGASLSTSAQFDTAQTKTGQYSLKLSTLSANRICTVAPQIAVTNQGIPPALPSTTYSYSFWMKTNKTSGDSAGAYIDFLERVGSGSAGTSHLSTQVNTTTDWTYYSGSFTTTANCRFITPKLFVEGNTGTATLIMDAWFDDITLVKSPVQTRTAVAVAPLPLVNAGFETAPPFTAATNVSSRYIDGTAGGSATDVGYKWITASCTNSEAKFDSAVKYTGDYSMKLSTLSSGAIVGAAQLKADIGFTVKPNTTYIMSYRIKTQLNSGSSSSGAYGSITRRKSDNTSIGTTYGSSVLTTQDWTTYSFTVTTTPETAYIEPAVSINGSNGAGTLIMDAWFDDIEIKEVIPQRKTPDNLLSNGNFEYAPPFTAVTTTTARWIDGTSGGSSATTGPYGWYIGAKGGSVAASFDSTAPLSGTNSLELSTTATASKIEVYSFSSGTAGKKLTLIPALPNTTYTMTFLMKTNVVSGSATGVNAGIFEYDGQGTNITSLRTTAVNTTTDKTFYTVTKTTSSTTRFIGAVIILEGSDGAGTLIMDAWFDDITLTTTAPYTKRKSIDNLVINGDFESVPTFTAATNVNGRWIDGTASGSSATEGPYKWACILGSSASSCSWQFDSTVSHSGTTSLKIDITNATGFANISNYSASPTWENAIPCLPSTSYTLSAWVKTTTAPAGGSYIQLRTLTGSFTTISTNSSSFLVGTNDWTLLTVTFTTESTARFIAPLLRTSTGQASTTWFDDVTLVKN
jgi:hypothetical protein